MGLKITLFDDDIIMISGGVVLTIDGLSQYEALISIADGDNIAMTSHRSGTSFMLTPAARCVVNQIYRTHDGLCVEIEVTAPRDVNIRRFHSTDSDDKLKFIISKFDDNDDVPKLVRSLATLEYSCGDNG
tara:strand:+ start:150 stop:539 length:390 start_codon:yes stop_codon:yes gene_type:complete